MAASTQSASGTLGLVDRLIDDGVALEEEVNTRVDETGVANASDALKLQLIFIRYSTQINASSQMVKTIGEAMNSTVRNIS